MSSRENVWIREYYFLIQIEPKSIANCGLHIKFVELQQYSRAQFVVFLISVEMYQKTNTADNGIMMAECSISAAFLLLYYIASKL